MVASFWAIPEWMAAIEKIAAACKQHNVRPVGALLVGPAVEN